MTHHHAWILSSVTSKRLVVAPSKNMRLFHLRETHEIMACRIKKIPELPWNPWKNPLIFTESAERLLQAHFRPVEGRCQARLPSL